MAMEREIHRGGRRLEPSTDAEQSFDRLVDEGTPMVGVIVRAIAAQLPRHVDRSELHRAGMLGLVEAARRYDPARGVPFSAYAARRVRGSVVDALRGDDWVPRSTRAAARRLESVEHSRSVDGEPCADAQLAEALGWSEVRVRRVREARERGVLMHLVSDDGVDVPIDDSIEDLVIRRESLGALVRALAVLPERERRVIVGYFLEGRSSSSVATELGVTESRVSQLRAHALATLRRVIESSAPQRGAGSASA